MYNKYEREVYGQVHELVTLGLIAAICQFITGWDAIGRVMLGWAAMSLVTALYNAWKAW